MIAGFRFRAGNAGQLYGIEPDLTTMGKIVGVAGREIKPERQRPRASEAFVPVSEVVAASGAHLFFVGFDHLLKAGLLCRDDVIR